MIPQALRAVTYMGISALSSVSSPLRARYILPDEAHPPRSLSSST